MSLILPTETPENKARAVLTLLDTIVECITPAREHGVSAHVLYVAFHHYGCTLERFNQLMGILVDTGRVTVVDDVYRAVLGPVIMDDDQEPSTFNHTDGIDRAER